MRQSSRQGFTLIELLVVIAIIAILAAILFPVFARVKAQALRISCLSNAKQMGLAVMAYASDYDELICLPNYFAPTPATPSNWGIDMIIWPDMILPYVKNEKVFACPARLTDSVGTAHGWGGTFTKPLGYALTSYTYSYAYQTGQFYYHLDRIKRPADKILFLEAPGYRVDFGLWYLGETWWPCKMHRGDKMNFIFCDGHAQALKPSQTVVPRLMWNLPDVYPVMTYPWPATWANSESEAQTQVQARFPAVFQ